jgi:hypothetical protein
VFSQLSDHVVEQGDLIVRERIRTIQEQIRDRSKKAGSAVARAARNRILDFGDQ